MNDLLDKLHAQGVKDVMTVGQILESNGAHPPAPDGPGSACPPAEPGNLILVVDTETTGIPLWHEPSDHADQPHVVQLAMELCSPDGTVLESYNQIVNPGVLIPPETIAMHGITDEMAAQGIDPKQAIADFMAWIARAQTVVGFALSFDLRMMRIAAARHTGEKWDCPIAKDDIKYAASAAYKIINGVGTKSLTLKMAYEAIIGEPMVGAHTADADVAATRRLFFKLRPEDARAAIGSNMPPEDDTPAETVAAMPDDGLTPFQRVEKEIVDLYAKAKQYLDGDPLANELQAADVAKLRDKIRDAASRAEKLRKDEAKPFDDGKAEVQARYNPLIQKDRGKTDLAIDACNATLKPWLKKVEDDQRAAAALLSAEAEGAAREARGAALAAADTGDLSKRETAESLLGDAKALLQTANRAATAKPQVQGGTRAVGLKSVYTPTMTDPDAALKHYKATRPAALMEWLEEQARFDCRGAGKPADIPGFTIKEDRVPV